jgi:hypothetical protein
MASVLAVAAAACGGRSPLAGRPYISPATTGPVSTAPGSTTPGSAGSAPTSSAPVTASPSTSVPTATTAPATTTPATTVPPTVAPTTAPDTAKALAILNAARSDALAERWAHVSGSQLVTVAGPDRGTQTVKIGSDSGLIKVLPNATYIQGSAAALQRLFDVPAAAATKVAGKWVILTPSDPEYKSVTIGVTLPSELQELDLQGTLRTESYSRNGTQGTLISGSLPPSANITKGLGALLVTTGPHPLPEEFAEFQATGATAFDETFSLWGAAELVQAPSGAVPLPTAGGGTVS